MKVEGRKQEKTLWCGENQDDFCTRGKSNGFKSSGSKMSDFIVWEGGRLLDKFMR